MDLCKVCNLYCEYAYKDMCLYDYSKCNYANKKIIANPTNSQIWRM